MANGQKTGADEESLDTEETFIFPETPETNQEPEPEQKAPEKAAKPDLEVEIVDDTPESDRNRPKLGENPEPTDEELAEYSQKVQARIKKLQHGYHDERREKEDAIRQRDEAVALAKQFYQQFQTAQTTGQKTEESAVEQLKKSTEGELSAVKKQLSQAYTEGDADKVADLTDQLADIKARMYELRNYRPQFTPQPPPETTGQPPEQPVYREQQRVPAPDQRATTWAERNSEWFRKDRVMTAAAYGVHEELVLNEGVDPNTQPDEYYKQLDSRLRKLFPTHDWGDTQPAPARRTNSAPVAGVTRSGGGATPGKVRLSKSEAEVARRLGVPLEEYAKQKLLLERQQQR